MALPGYRASGRRSRGLRPAPPASVAADGIVASLNDGPVMVARPGIGEATLLPEASLASSAAAAGSQAPVMIDVPKEEVAYGVAPGRNLRRQHPRGPHRVACIESSARHCDPDRRTCHNRTYRATRDRAQDSQVELNRPECTYGTGAACRICAPQVRR